ncbi:MAG: hypothetical protein ACI9F9_003256, partial [Candidatus Paceibacteria bacterium]
MEQAAERDRTLERMPCVKDARANILLSRTDRAQNVLDKTLIVGGPVAYDKKPITETGSYQARFWGQWATSLAAHGTIRGSFSLANVGRSADLPWVDAALAGVRGCGGG